MFSLRFVDYVVDTRLQEHQKYMESADDVSSQHDALVVGVSVTALDADYKALMKGPIRLLEV